MNGNAEPPTKKLKQAQISFKVLGSKPSVNTPVASGVIRKRKLSDSTPTSLRAIKTSRPEKTTGPKVHHNADNEVTSSSEAEITKTSSAGCGSVQPGPEKPIGSLDKFVRSTPTQKAEISTSCADIIDITSCDGSVEDPVEVTKEAQSFVDSCVHDEEEANVSEGTGNDKENEGAFPNGVICKNKGSTEVSLDVENESLSFDDSVLDESAMDLDSSMVSLTESPNTSLNTSTPLTSTNKSKAPRSAKVSEERRKMRKEKERLKAEKLRQREEAKAEREKLKQDEKERKEKEREEQRKKKEQLLKEKEEKTRQREDERRKKEEEKEEERRKKQEVLDAKNEEKKKKDEEKKKRDEEKTREEEEQRKKKEKQLARFKGFFKKSDDVGSKGVGAEERSGPFMAFEVKKDMKLAPVLRVREDTLSERSCLLDALLLSQDSTQLYIDQLQSGQLVCGTAAQTWPLSEDVELVSGPDLLHPSQPHYTPKLLQFHQNHRPPYYGTWRKKSTRLTPRNPFRKDEGLFDYEVESDDEWEEEEPGESLSNSEGEDSDGETGADEEDEDGFFVPHGYLSEGEGCESDNEDLSPERLKAQQIAKARAWDAQMKKQCEVLRPVCVGCCWWPAGGHTSTALAAFTVVSLDTTPISLAAPVKPTIAKDKKKPPVSDNKGKNYLPVPDQALVDLASLVHGNVAGTKRLVREFRAFWQSKVTTAKTEESGQTTPSGDDIPAVNNDQADDSQSEATMQTTSEGGGSVEGLISKRQLDTKIREIAVYEKRDSHPLKCWFVRDSVLDKLGLSALPVPTQWTWVTKTTPKKKPLTTPSPDPKLDKPPQASTPSHPSIKLFTVSQSSPVFATPNTPKVIRNITPNKSSMSPASVKSGLSPAFNKLSGSPASMKPGTSPTTKSSRSPASVKPSSSPAALKSVLPDRLSLKPVVSLSRHTVQQFVLAESPQDSPKQEANTSTNVATPKRRVQTTCITPRSIVAPVCDETAPSPADSWQMSKSSVAGDTPQCPMIID